MSTSGSDARILVARDLLDRWDAQQRAYIKHRALRFETIVETVAELCPKAPRVLDLACGPGSLTRAVLTAIPDAHVVGVDKDPVLVALARDVFAGDTRVEIVDADLDLPAWRHAIDGPFDAVISSTALHWLKGDVLARLYFELADMIQPGGVFLNGDHMLYDDIAQPGLRRLAKADDEKTQKQAFDAGADTWDAWWDAAEAVPAYADAVKERARRWQDKTAGPKVTLGYHLQTLRSAGFSEIGTVWQYFDDYVVSAIR